MSGRRLSGDLYYRETGAPANLIARLSAPITRWRVSSATSRWQIGAPVSRWRVSGPRSR